ncbi:MAG: CotH kinase family protein [Crocinitomicaceae bacterium]|nr:CotH kinase family protein [Crocinitomicaceae bacterium]
MSRKINWKKVTFRTIIVLMILGSVGAYFANRFVQSKGFEGLRDFISVYRHNLDLRNDVEPDHLKIKISKKDFKFLKNKRQEALDRGIQINEGNSYVDCELITGDETIEGEIRLKGHMLDHLEGDKWSFRVKTKDEKEYKGMYRFSLQHPGTRNYAYEWVYHELLKSQGIIALKYDFIHLKLNKNDLGIYALEEHFGQHIPQDNNRPRGAILRWNPELYWDWRINELDGKYIDNENGNYASSFVEPYDKGVVRKDSVLVNTYLKGAALLEAFRRGEKVTSEVFDVQKMARFHAIIDLVGGYHSLDWSDVKFFYNSETKKVEPVGYESFSVRETHVLAGQRKPEDYDGLSFDYHDRLFSDPAFFEAYVSALYEICNEEFLNSFIAKIQPDLDKKLGILAHEFPYIKFSFDPYFRNVDLIQENLSLAKPLHAFVEEKNDSIVTISVSPVSDFPIIIESLEIDKGNSYPSTRTEPIPPKARDTYAKYFMIEFKYAGEKVKNPVLKCRIPGGSEIYEIEVLEIPSYTKEELLYPSIPNFQSTDSLLTIREGELFFNQKDVEITGSLSIPRGKTLVMYPGQHFKFSGDGLIGGTGNIRAIGTADAPIIIELNNPHYEVAIDIVDGTCNMEHVQIMGTGDFIKSKRSELNFQHAVFADLDGKLITARHSEIVLNECHSGSVNSWGYFENCLVNINRSTANKGENFMVSAGSLIKIKESEIQAYDQAFELDHISSVTLWVSSIQDVRSIAVLNNASSFQTLGGSLQAGETPFEVDQDSYSTAKSGYNLYKTTTNFEG